MLVEDKLLRAGAGFRSTIAALAGVTAGLGALAGQTPPSTPLPARFLETTSAIGVGFKHAAPHTSKKYLLETMGSGVALFDYDNDGRLDLFLVNGAEIDDPSAPGSVPQKTAAQYFNRLYHQKADGRFEDVTEKAGLQGTGYGMGVAVGDYDNDGYEDLFVTSYGGNHLYHNDGDGTFTDVTAKAGVQAGGWSTSAAWADLDGDGLLDLVVLRYLEWDFADVWCGEKKQGYRSFCHPDQFPPVRPLVYHNDGNGRFTEVGEKSGFRKPGKGLGLAIADFNGDGHIDVFVANDSVPEQLYENKGDGTFEETALLAGAAVDADGRVFAGMGVDFADYDNDGVPDLAVTDLAYQKYALFRNNGDGTFAYATDSSGLGAMTLLNSGWGMRFLDYDNDGWKDLLVAQAHVLDTVQLTYPQLRYRQPMLLARNTGHGFVDVSAESGGAFHENWASRGLAIGDIDNDGRIDAVVTENAGPAHILHNETNTGNHWLTLELVGHKSNRDAIGAEVRIATAQGAQTATVTTASSYLSSGDKRVHFGLGRAASVRELKIRWPSGIVENLRDVKGDQILRVEEPAK
ncbi:MAG: CRTAC1 family protein [Acidobacteria bacterium]|nr:CRTAC1 family protein [Acidobacteriota bacterium]